MDYVLVLRLLLQIVVHNVLVWIFGLVGAQLHEGIIGVRGVRTLAGQLRLVGVRTERAVASTSQDVPPTQCRCALICGSHDSPAQVGP